jgi:predicted phage terminase large subunit-like protein
VFADLKRAVRQQADLHDPQTVLIEDKSSGSSLIQDLRGVHVSRVQATPSLDGDKVMRLRGQTAKIEGGFVLFPKDAPWLNAYLTELLAFPKSRHDDQVDSTVFALAWWGSKTHYAWNEEAIEGMERLYGSIAFDGLFRGRQI